MPVGVNHENLPILWRSVPVSQIVFLMYIASIPRAWDAGNVFALGMAFGFSPFYSRAFPFFPKAFPFFPKAFPFFFSR